MTTKVVGSKTESKVPAECRRKVRGAAQPVLMRRRSKYKQKKNGNPDVSKNAPKREKMASRADETPTCKTTIFLEAAPNKYHFRKIGQRRLKRLLFAQKSSLRIPSTAG